MTPFNLRRRLIILISRSLAPLPEEPPEEEEMEEMGAGKFVFLPSGGLPASPTMRNGPPGPNWVLKVVDCHDQHDPAYDPEVQGLLAVGWEPYSVHKFQTPTGVGGIRMYFKRAIPAREYGYGIEA